MVLSGMKLAGDPKCLQIGKGAAAGEVAEVGGPSEHGGEALNGLDFHLRAGAASIEGVVVGIDPGCKRIGCTSDRVGRLEHLAGVEGVEIGVILAEAGCRFVKYSQHRGVDRAEADVEWGAATRSLPREWEERVESRRAIALQISCRQLA